MKTKQVVTIAEKRKMLIDGQILSTNDVKCPRKAYHIVTARGTIYGGPRMGKYLDLRKLK